MTGDCRPRRRKVRLLASALTAALATGGPLFAPPTALAAGGPRGHDVSSHQGRVDWKKAHGGGARFAYVKATESTTYVNPYFRGQFDGARDAGLLHGAYHFALPDKSTGKAQAEYFLRNGGGWRADGWTLPPALDVERNPYGATCYGLSRAATVAWIRDFSDEVRARTGRRPVIYTSTEWWTACTGGTAAFARDHPLWVADYGARPHPLPAGWRYWTFWQHDDGGPLPGDQDVFNGDMTHLRRLAKG